VHKNNSIGSLNFFCFIAVEKEMTITNIFFDGATTKINHGATTKTDHGATPFQKKITMVHGVFLCACNGTCCIACARKKQLSLPLALSKPCNKCHRNKGTLQLFSRRCFRIKTFYLKFTKKIITKKELEVTGFYFYH